MSTMTRRAFLGMAGVAGAGLWLGLPGTARADVTRETRVMLGTFVDVSLSGTSSMQASEALERAFAEAARLEKVFSRYDGGTPVSELNRAGTLRDCPPELTRLVNRSLFYGAVTGGGFDITVQPVVDLFRARRNPQGRLRLDEAELRAARELVGYKGLRVAAGRLSLVRSGMGVTLDGIAKGYIADRMSAVLTACGVENHLVNAGGDIASHGCKAPACRGAWPSNPPRIAPPTAGRFPCPAGPWRPRAAMKSITTPRAGITTSSPPPPAQAPRWGAYP